jgi:hypothetical protein
MADNTTLSTDSGDEQTPPNPDVLPLPKKGMNSMGAWKSRIKGSQKIIEDFSPEWNDNQRRYLAERQKDDDNVTVPTLFQRTEAKKSQLAAQSPKVVVSGSLPGLDQAAKLFEEVLNEQLYMAVPDGVDAMTALDEVLSDALVPSGIFAVKIGYENVIDGEKQVQVGQIPDPNFVPNPMLPPEQQQPPMVPQMETVPNVIFERLFMERLSPSKLLIPEEFRGSNYDLANWLGEEALLDWNIAKRAFIFPDDFNHFVSDDEHIIGKDKNPISFTSDKRKLVRLFIIYYKSAVFDDTVKHPWKQRCLVLVDGLDEPVKHEDSKYQRTAPDGTLTGMIGFPIHIGTLRSASDTAFPPSDASYSVHQEVEINDARTDMKLQRKRAIPMRLGDLGVLGPDGLAKIEKGEYQSIIPVATLQDVKPIQVVDQAHYNQENFSINTVVQQDLDATWALGANPSGAVTGPASTSAAATGAANQASANRIGRERNKFMRWYARGVEKLASLIQLFATDTAYVHSVGPEGAQILKAWSKDDIQGRFSFRILPNSSVDVSEQRQDFLAYYNLVAASPNVNRLELDTTVSRLFDQDPQKVIAQPQPPPPPPPALPHGITLNLNGKDLNPLVPEFAMIVQLLKASGVAIPDDAIAQAQAQAAKTGMPVTEVTPSAPPPGAMPPAGPGAGPEAPGSVEKVQPLDKHQFDNTGELPGPRVQ